MAKSRGRKFAELVAPANGVFDAASIPTIALSKLASSTFSVNSESASLGGNVVIDSNDVTEHTNALYFTNARADARADTRITAAALLPLAGGTMTGNLTLGDNVNAYFGASTDLRIYHDGTNSHIINSTGELRITGSNIAVKSDSNKLYLGAGDDLQIYHDGSNSYIKDTGTGDLFVQGSSNIYFRKGDGGEVFAHFADDGACKLRFDNSTKLATTATGIQTTGTISVNGAYTLPTSDGSANQVLQTDGSGTLSFANAGSGSSVFSTSGSNAYYTSGSVGIGTNSPNAPLEVSGGTAMTGGWGRTMLLRHNFPVLVFQSEYSTDAHAGIGYDNSTGMKFWVNSANIDLTGNSQTPALTILDNKNVGIGMQSPSVKLDVNGAGKFAGNLTSTVATNTGILGVAYGTDYFGLKTSSQTLSSEYMIISANAGTFVSATSNNSVYIRYGGNDSTNQLVIGSGATELKWRANTVWTAENDGSGSGLDADLLDGNHGSYYGVLDHIRSLGTTAFTGTATTAGLITEMESDGAFDSYSSVFKTSWSYAGNFDLSDAGRFTETAGSSWITWTDNSSDSTRGNITALVIAPNTGGSAGKMFAYNDQGSGYSPGWREIWTSTSDGAGSGLDADLLDGLNAKGVGSATGASQVLTSNTNSYFVHQNWIDVGTAGIYSGTNGAHFYPNTGTSYATWRSAGARGGYDGIMFDSGGDSAIMYDSSGNGGLYREANGRWHIYHNVANNCLGVCSSGTSSSYGLYEQGGGIYSSSNIVAYSDRRIKENIVPIDNALEKVNKLAGVYYNKINDETKTKEMGFIAQDVNEVAPELVTYAEDIDQYGVKYGNTTALLVEAVKELTQQVKDLKQELEELKNG